MHSPDRSAAPARIGIARRGQPKLALVAEALRAPPGHQLARVRDAAVVDDGVLHCDVHSLAASRAFTLEQRCQYADGEVKAAPGIADGRAGLQRRAAWAASHAQGAADRLPDVVKSEIVAVGA